MNLTSEQVTVIIIVGIAACVLLGVLAPASLAVFLRGLGRLIERIKSRKPEDKP